MSLLFHGITFYIEPIRLQDSTNRVHPRYDLINMVITHGGKISNSPLPKEVKYIIASFSGYSNRNEVLSMYWTIPKSIEWLEINGWSAYSLIQWFGGIINECNQEIWSGQKVVLKVDWLFDCVEFNCFFDQTYNWDGRRLRGKYQSDEHMFTPYPAIPINPYDLNGYYLSEYYLSRRSTREALPTTLHDGDNDPSRSYHTQPVTPPAAINPEDDSTVFITNPRDISPSDGNTLSDPVQPEKINITSGDTSHTGTPVPLDPSALQIHLTDSNNLVEDMQLGRNSITSGNSHGDNDLGRFDSNAAQDEDAIVETENITSNKRVDHRSQNVFLGTEAKIDFQPVDTNQSPLLGSLAPTLRPGSATASLSTAGTTGPLLPSPPAFPPDERGSSSFAPSEIIQHQLSSLSDTHTPDYMNETKQPRPGTPVAALILADYRALDQPYEDILANLEGMYKGRTSDEWKNLEWKNLVNEAEREVIIRERKKFEMNPLAYLNNNSENEMMVS